MYALIRNGMVENCIVADASFVETIVGDWDDIVTMESVETCSIGYHYSSGVFTPPAQQQIKPKRTLTKLEYMDRFTDTELAGIYTAAKSTAQVEIWLEKFKLATEVNLDDPRTVAGLQGMEAAGLLAAGRAAEIIA